MMNPKDMKKLIPKDVAQFINGVQDPKLKSLVVSAMSPKLLSVSVAEETNSNGSATSDEAALAKLTADFRARAMNSAVELLVQAAEDVRHYELECNMKDCGDPWYRYQVIRKPGWWPLRGYAVVAGTGTMYYFEGTKKACQNVALRCVTSFRDGEYLAEQSLKGRVRKDIMDAIHAFDQCDSGIASITALRIAERVRDIMLTKTPVYYEDK